MSKRLINLDEVKEKDEEKENKILETLASSFAEAAARQQDLLTNAVNTINGSHYLAAFESFSEQIKKFKEAVELAVPKLPKIEIPDFTIQAIRDVQKLLPIDPGPKLIDDVEWMAMEVSRPVNRNDVTMLEERIDAVSNEVSNLSGVLVANTDAIIICATCNEILAKVQYMLTGQIKCWRCKKLRNIPSKEVRIVVPSHN